ncbi:uncharacterized protein PRCAT00005645001 [Priceomyces carsonii]|uniref:uncharacterized protein n=1 Tax=Priceomyces carsonii TaxID=28549 RepID=UPI002ED862E0|nr:unnamed protein product [Priceomyces carsonii]
MRPIDYSLYLVTDSTMIPESSTFLNQVGEAIKNGATVVQLREKNLATSDFIERAKEVHKLTQAANIALLINDRVDVALAIGAEGVHIGQDDMPALLARKLMGADKIIGVTCSNPEEVKTVVKEATANYVGLGTVYATNTKKDVATPSGVGPIGIRKMLRVLEKHNQSVVVPIKCVAIGGINQRNAARVCYQSSIPNQRLDGVAVVSCIMASESAGKDTSSLLSSIKSPLPWQLLITEYSSSLSIDEKIKSLISRRPVVHHITNNVVKNFSANVTLAIGASPVMSEFLNEFEEFAANIPNVSLLINTGTPTPEMMKIFKKALAAYNALGRHIVMDPVACGASQARLEACKELLNNGQPTVIKGNIGEIASILKLTSTYTEKKQDGLLMHGVDSVANIPESTIMDIGKEVSRDFKVVVVITGPMNYIISGDRIAKVAGGSELMGSITGTGCALGSTIAAFLGARADGQGLGETFDIFEAIVGAVYLYNICGKKASLQTHSPGSFMAKFLDELYLTTHNLD